MKSVFTVLWFLKLNFSSDCVYYTSFILDVVLFFWLTPYGFGQKGYYDYWPQWIFYAASIVALLMAIFAIIQLITKSGSAGSRHDNYVQARFFTILGLAIGGIILFVLGMTYYSGSMESRLKYSFQFGSPLILLAAALHSYHENFT